jgi:hypothetical protein
MLAGPVFPYTFAAGKFRVEARNLIMGHAKASEVPTPADAVMELRGGALTTTTGLLTDTTPRDGRTRYTRNT